MVYFIDFCSILLLLVIFFEGILSLIRDNYFLFPFRKVFEDINSIHCHLYDHNVIIACSLCVYTCEILAKLQLYELLRYLKPL